MHSDKDRSIDCIKSEFKDIVLTDNAASEPAIKLTNMIRV